MKRSNLNLAIKIGIVTLSMATTAQAAGLERSQQPIAPLFADGNYAEASYAYVKPNITGTDIIGNKVTNMMDDYGMTGAAIKIAPSKNTALALFYNAPSGVDTTYPKDNIFNNNLGATQAHVKTESLGLVVGGKPHNSNITVYGGVEYQTVSGYVKGATPLGLEKAMSNVTQITQAVLTASNISEAKFNQLVAGDKAGLLTDKQQQNLNDLNTAIRQQVETIATSSTLYQLDFEDDSTLVPMVGLAYEKPEIKLRASITYRAPAKYNVKAKESLTVTADPSKNITELPGKTNVEFPQSISFDFQTGLSEKHQLLGMVNARWVDWSDFSVSPPLNSQLQAGEPLASYPKDQYSIEVAIAKQFTPKLAAEIRGSYDSGTGTPLSALGPYDSVIGIALGAEYSLTEQFTIGGGAQYMMIKGGHVTDANGQTVLTIDDSDGYALGMKLGYHF